MANLTPKTTGQKNKVAQDMVKFIGDSFTMGDTQRKTLAHQFGLTLDDVQDIENRVKTILGRAILPPELLTGKAKPYESGD